MLAERQAAFLAEVSAADDGPVCSSAGMAVYRNAYRARLCDALNHSFERTRRWVGEDPFAAAAAHFVLTHPSATWTLDAYGDAFPATLAELFREHPEVAELAWLEWRMQQAFAAPDQPELTATGLAGAELADGDWDRVVFTPAAGFSSRPVHHDLAQMWNATSFDNADEKAPVPCPEQRLIVWRKGAQPHFRHLGLDEWQVLGSLAGGMAFGAAAALADDPSQLGHWLAGWIGDGVFSDITIAPR